MEPDGAEGDDGIATHCDQSANSMKKESLNPEMEDHLNGLDVSPEKVRALAMALTENGFYSLAQLTKEIAYLDSVLKDFPSMDQIKIKRHHQGEAEAAKLKAAEVKAEAAKAKMAKVTCSVEWALHSLVSVAAASRVRDRDQCSHRVRSQRRTAITADTEMNHRPSTHTLMVPACRWSGANKADIFQMMSW